MTNLAEVLHLIRLIWKHKVFSIAGVSITLGSLIMALTFLLFAARFARFMTKIIDKKIIQPFVDEASSQTTYRTLVYYGSLSLMVALSLTFAGIPLTVFTVLGGALAIGVGFGSQNIVNNFISGIILLFEKPIKVGDVVELDNIAGKVLSIGTRSTKIKNGDNKIFVVPNSFFLEKSVLNWTYEQSEVRTTLDFGVAYGSNPKEVKKYCEEILNSHTDILKNPTPLVLFNNFNESNLDFQLAFWCDLNKVSSLAEVRSSLRFEIDDKFKQAGIEMAFPQRDINLKLPKGTELRLKDG